MTKKDKGESDGAVDTNARFMTSPEDKAKAQQWFDRARELGEKRQFDYAIEYYVNGLEFSPDSVEDACKPLHGCAVARRQLGGKKPGFKDAMKRSMNDKDPKKAYVNSLWLFGHDPDNVTYIEGVAKNASRLRAEDAATWAGGVLLKFYESNSKVSGKQFVALAKLLEEMGDRAAARSENKFAVNVLQMGVEALNVWRKRTPKDRNMENALRDLSTKLTILKGKYKDGESFRDSIADKEHQEDLHDVDRTHQADERVDQLIAKAEQEYRANPDSSTALNKLVDLLCRRDREEDELKAIDILMDDYERTEIYRRKHMADDIRMKQLGRRVRAAQKSGDAEKVKECQVASLKLDLSVFKDRVDRYPTDNRYKYEYAVRLFNAGRFDDAIPLFQSARSDPKNRSACAMFVGRCFFKKGYYSQAISTLEAELGTYEYSDDTLAKSMIYWLGRAQEADKQTEEAKKTYGKLLELDYTFRDVRGRMEGLASADAGEG